jgi:hypothetical protein
MKMGVEPLNSVLIVVCQCFWMKTEELEQGKARTRLYFVEMDIYFNVDVLCYFLLTIW